MSSSGCSSSYFLGVVRGAKEMLENANDGVRLGKKGYGVARKRFGPKVHEQDMSEAQKNDGRGKDR